MESIKRLPRLPLWEHPTAHVAFNTGMEQNAPFIVTQHQQRSDLGMCVISTTSPHYVAKIHGFKTCADHHLNKQPNERMVQRAEQENIARMDYLHERAQAWHNQMVAEQQHISVRQLIEEQGRVYDEELDEARIVAKVPGLNVYLELIGCLDDIDLETISWDKYDRTSPLYVLQQMALWGQNIFDSKDRRQRASQLTDGYQPLEAWQEQYNPEIRPWMPRKRGLGHTFIDPSRRPELLYTHVPQGDREGHEVAKLLKAATADLAANGIAPENYGQ